MEALLMLVIVVAALGGAGLGFMLGGRQAAALRAEAHDIRNRCNEAEKQLAVATNRAEAAELLRPMLTSVTVERDDALQKLAAMGAKHTEREESHQQQLKRIEEAEIQLRATFDQLAARALDDAQTKLLKRATDRFAEAEKANETKLRAILQPVETLLKGQTESLARVEKERVDQYAGLIKAVEQMNRVNDQARLETSRLAGVLRSSPKARGRWGEEQLRTILESAGLAPNVDFEIQATRTEEGQQFRPDCVIRLPGGKCIVVDVKCPLTAFERAYDEENEDIRAALLLDHANAVRTYATELGRKAYWDKFENTPDFVIMFIPGEHFLSAAAERLPSLISEAFKNKVVIASTINLLALARMMAWMWKQEHAAREAREFVSAGKKLHAGMRTMVNKIVDLGSRLEKASGSYNDFIGSLERNVLVQARKLEDLDTMYGEAAIADIPPVTSPIRPLVKLALPTSADAASADDPASNSPPTLTTPEAAE
ncbi:MAG TPA: DNA recombination protein RmuC [Allosphingosinicella sp.]|jgi:DNA recombination protein RmuC